MGAETEFIFIRLPILRECLTKELEMTDLPFKQDIEVSVSPHNSVMKQKYNNYQR